eukprot:TRINITY_DN1497_c0_g1_i10.p1 TRINITY_DN1497_c0_g1~~TRINITY_DN1497_c0_g1_i10.p1  ORF type:complete len:175 (-),score=31.38 TRINITY_DN1497_c0_g1_i10:164-688(-)
MLWSGDFHGTFLGTDIATGEQVVKITTESGIRSLAAHPKNPRFVFCGLLDGFVVKIDVELMSVALSQQPHSNWIRTAAFSPSGALLITGADDHLVQILDETTLQPVATLRAHTSDIRGAQFLADGRFITVSDDRSIRVCLKLWFLAICSRIYLVAFRYGIQTSLLSKQSLAERR